MTFFARTFPTCSVTQVEPIISYHNLDFELAGQTCANYIIHLFASVKYRPPSPHSAWQFTLASYITDVVYVSGLDAAVLVHAMTLLCRYKQEAPLRVACGNDAHRLFLTAYIIAAKVTYDKQIKMAAWVRVGRGKFTREELLQTEIQFCQELEWDVQIERQSFQQFAEILNELAGLEYFEEEIIASESSFQYGDTSSVLSTPPPVYQETEQETEIRIIRSLEGILLSPAGSVESLDKDEGLLLSRMAVSAPSRPRCRRRSSIPTAKNPIRRSFKTTMMDLFSCKPRIF